MNAMPWLTLAARALGRRRLEAVLVGNAAAALQGSPVTTLDFDFMFRRTPGNLTKLRRIADDLDAVILTPYYPASDLFRLVRQRDGVQLDFMTRLDGIRSFESLRSGATRMRFGRSVLLVAALEDVIRSKAAANRPQDRAVLPVLRRTLRERKALEA
jgi:hypothetical protein